MNRSGPPEAGRRRRRVLRWILIASAVVVVLGAVGVLVFRSTLPTDRLDVLEPAGLDVEADVTGRWTVDDLTITLDADGLTVGEDGRVVWASPAGRAFVLGGRGDVDWEEHRGYLWPDVSHETRLEKQTVTGVEASPDAVVLSGQVAGTGTEQTSWRMTITSRTDGGAVMDVETDDTTSVALVSGRSDGAAVHGFGEQFAPFDLDGRLLPIVVREQGVGRGEQPISFLADLTNRSAAGTDQTTYAARATFVTEDLRGLRLDPDQPESHAFALADTREPDRVTLESWASTLRAEVMSGDTPQALVAEQAAGARRPDLARWDGAVVGLQGGTAEVRRELDVLLRAGTEVSAVWLQDWTGQRTTSFGERLWWTWQLDERRYPEWDELVADLADQGIATTTYVNPFLVDAGPKGDPAIRNLWAEAAAAGHLVEQRDGSPYLLDQGGFQASLVDLTDRDARDWFADVIAEDVLGQGVDGFMADFAEGLPLDAVLAEGDAALAHNAWPSLWAETVRTACERAGRPDCVTWFRSGALGQEEHASMYWAGDQLTSWSVEDGLASVLPAIFSSGVSGWPLVHSDVGGYTSIYAVVKDYVRSPELLRRWAELEAFGVLMRTHEGNRPDAGVQVFSSAATARDFAAMTRVHAALAPYRSAVVTEALRTGVPALRHGWLVEPGTAAASVDTQFFLGDDVLVAPVVEAGVASVEVTFPPGRWTHLLTGESFVGDRVVTVDAPLGTPAAFVRTDSPWTDRLVAALRQHR